MTSTLRAIVTSIATITILASGCKYPPDKPYKPPTDGGGNCVEPVLDPDRSLVVHDPAQLAAAFPLRRTLQQIIDTSGGTTTPEALLQTMLDSFLQTSFVHGGKTLPVLKRSKEAALPVAQLLDPTSANGMIPTGLFNRFDLIPEDVSHCGEYRIVYAKKSSGPLDRFFIIFESALPNPNTGAGLAGCKPVADLWIGLSSEPNPAQRIAKLESFYYTGLPSFSPVVAYANYGVPFGQVRTNLFVVTNPGDAEPWVLREHRTALAATPPAFVVDTVKQNPLTEWYRPPSTLPAGLTPADQKAFRDHFLDGPVCNLVRTDRSPGATPFKIVNDMGAGFDPLFDEFQSVALGTSDDPAVNADPPFVSAIGPRLASLNPGSVDTPQLLNRAGAMTCGGCHQFSNGKPLGNGATWPNSNGFTHIDEQGGLSPALTGDFLKRRGEILARFACDPTPEPKPQASCPPMAATALRAMARRAAPAAAPDEALASAASLEPATIARMTRGRTTPVLQQIDTARLAALGAQRQAARAPAPTAATARRTVTRAQGTLADLVTRARLEEQARPGAFVPVRRPH